MIEITNLVKNYGNHEAVKNVSFTVEDGQIVGLLGPNGAGKSTTMNIITGYLAATSGTVLVGGLDISKKPDQVKRMIGYLPEMPPLYTDMTVTEYLDLVGELKGLKKAERKEETVRAMEAVHVSEMASRLIKGLSKGYKQRVGLASSLIGNPPLLILDEPTVGLDPSQIIEIRELIKTLGESHTIILSSHILSEVSAVCDHIVIIDKGMVVAQDTPEHLSETFARQNVLNIEVKGSREAVEEALHGCDKVREFQIIEEKSGILRAEVYAKVSEEERNRVEEQMEEQIAEQMEEPKVVAAEQLTEEAKPTDDIREDLFYLFAERRLPVYQMTYENLSLEEVFLKLTSEEDEDDASNL